MAGRDIAIDSPRSVASPVTLALESDAAVSLRSGPIRTRMVLAKSILTKAKAASGHLNFFVFVKNSNSLTLLRYSEAILAMTGMCLMKYWMVV